jgi:hypothetical protein
LVASDAVRIHAFASQGRICFNLRWQKSMLWSPRKVKGAHASLDARAPLRRSDDLVIEELGEELLIYDRTSKRGHCLSPDAARVWRACDGSTDIATISANLGLPIARVREALDELEATQLLDQGFEVVQVGSENGNRRGVTRRELAVRSAKVGGAVAAAPLILSITAPTAMASLTPTLEVCLGYTTTSCGTTGGCGRTAGCCCCCQGGTGGVSGSCKICGPTSLCNGSTADNAQVCRNNVVLFSSGGCSNIGTINPPNAAGCCGDATQTGCGCAYENNPNQATGSGGVGQGAGCCNTSTTPATGCNPGDAGCNATCCNGTKIDLVNSPFGCCPAPSAGNTSIGTCVAATS